MVLNRLALLLDIFLIIMNCLQIVKVVDSATDNVIAFGASFSQDADSHLVCVQNDEGVYQTQAINIQNLPRKGTYSELFKLIAV